MHGGKNDVRIAVGSAFRHRHRPDGELGLGKGSSQQLLHVGGRETRAREQLPADNIAVGVAESGDEEHAAGTYQPDDAAHVGLPVGKAVGHRIGAIGAQHHAVVPLLTIEALVVAHIDLQQGGYPRPGELLAGKNVGTVGGFALAFEGFRDEWLPVVGTGLLPQPASELGQIAAQIVPEMDLGCASRQQEHMMQRRAGAEYQRRLSRRHMTGRSDEKGDGCLLVGLDGTVIVREVGRRLPFLFERRVGREPSLLEKDTCRPAETVFESGGTHIGTGEEYQRLGAGDGVAGDRETEGTDIVGPFLRQLEGDIACGTQPAANAEPT